MAKLIFISAENTKRRRWKAFYKYSSFVLLALIILENLYLVLR